MGRPLLFALCLLSLLRLEAYECSPTRVIVPFYQGGFYGGFTWLYFLPTLSDGDLQYATALTLTGPPLSVDETQNLSAHVLQIEPDYNSAYRFNLGYALPCANSSLDLEYFHFSASDSDSATSPVRNAETYQFLQNFLGGGYVSADAKDSQRIDQIDLSYGQQFILDYCFKFHPYIGVSYAYIKRNLDVELTNFVVPPLVDPVSAHLTGSLRSKYWGIGPTIGSDFSFSIFRYLAFTGHLGVSALGGKVTSDIDSNSIRESLFQSFSATDSSYRITPVVRSDLGFTYSLPLCRRRLALELSAGYEVDYYFRVVDRVNPDNGYVNNPSSTPTNTTGSIGLGGPYAQVALTTASRPCEAKNLIKVVSLDQNPARGFYFSIENSWLEPRPTDKDLTYAILNLSEGSSKDQEIVPDHSWSGCYHLGYRLPCNLNLDAGYRYFQNNASDSVTTRSLEGISSLNASGPAGVLFSNASSRVKYRFHQLDLTGGTFARFCNPLELYGFAGLRYLNLERTLHNAYLGGDPAEITESKFPQLTSNQWGVGPLMGFRPSFYVANNFGLTGLFDIALLVGSTKSKLDQVNFGTLLDETSNTLQTRDTQAVVPVIDTKIGAFWVFKLRNCLEIDLEVGYLFSDYFRAINLVFPNFLTGLGQTNSSLLLGGPYITINIGGF